MQKPLQIAFRNVDKSGFVESLIRERVDRLERFHSDIISCRVVVEAPYRSSEGGKPPLGISVEVEIPRHNTLIAKGIEEQREMKADHTRVINRSFEAIERQLSELSDIRDGIVKQHAGTSEVGRLARLFPDQNYGFVEVKGGPDLYFTRNAVIGCDFDDLRIDMLVRITRATTEGPMGPQASSVRLADAQRSGN